MLCFLEPPRFFCACPSMQDTQSGALLFSFFDFVHNLRLDFTKSLQLRKCSIPIFRLIASKLLFSVNFYEVISSYIHTLRAMFNNVSKVLCIFSFYFIVCFRNPQCLNSVQTQKCFTKSLQTIETIVWCIFSVTVKNNYHSFIDSIYLTSKLWYLLILSWILLEFGSGSKNMKIVLIPTYVHWLGNAAIQ